MEINLSSEEKDLKPQQQKHASSPDLSLPRTGEVDAINNNFKSLDYVPGSGGTYASMGSHQPVPLSQLSYPSSDTQNMRAHPIAGSEAQRSHTSLLRILVIIFCSVLLAVSGLVLLNDLQPGEGLDINDLMALMSGKPPDSAESSERNQALNNKDLKDSSLLPHPEEIRSEESSLQNMLAPVPIEGGIQSQSDSEMIRKSDRLPYLYLSEINRKEPPESMPVAPVWSASQEQLWRQGIAHKFPWQRYKTVMEVRAERPEQSQVILYDALNDPQFWTRMRAVIALAESGIPVPSKTVKQAIGSEEKSLVARFFKRFSLKNSAGERYILRMAINYTSPSGRVTILRALMRYSITKENHGLYLAAGLKDPDSRVRKVALHYAAHQPSGWLAEQQETFQDLSSKAMPDLDQSPQLPPLPPQAPREAEPIQIDQIEIFSQPDTVQPQSVHHAYDVEFKDKIQ